MQAIILAAGKSTRTYPLTISKPKPLLKVANKTIFEHNIENLKDLVEEIIVVVGFKKEMIEKFISEKFPDLNVKYVEQKEQLGTGHAVSIVEEQIKDRFMLILADNLYSQQDFKEISSHKNSILVQKVKNPENYGVILEKEGFVKDIIEKPKEFISDLVISGLYSLDKSIFEYLKQTKKSERNEYELTDALKLLAENKEVHCVKSKVCFQISHPWDLLTADAGLRGNENLIGNSNVSGSVENSSIGDNCDIKGKVSGSIIMDNVVIEEGSVVEDSVIGDNVKFSGTAKSAENVKSFVKGSAVMVERLGTIIGDNVVADGVDIKSGCKVWPDKKISGLVDKDIE